MEHRYGGYSFAEKSARLACAAAVDAKFDAVSGDLEIYTNHLWALCGLAGAHSSINTFYALLCAESLHMHAILGTSPVQSSRSPAAPRGAVADVAAGRRARQVGRRRAR